MVFVWHLGCEVVEFGIPAREHEDEGEGAQGKKDAHGPHLFGCEIGGCGTIDEVGHEHDAENYASKSEDGPRGVEPVPEDKCENGGEGHIDEGHLLYAT